MSQQPPRQRKGQGASESDQASMVQLGKLIGGENQQGIASDFDREVQRHLDRIYAPEHERDRMEAAMRGEEVEGENVGSTDMGPGQFENTQAQQQQTLGQQASVQSAQQAQTLQAQQTPPSPQGQPPGQEGISVPYKAQRGNQGLSGGPGAGPPETDKQP